MKISKSDSEALDMLLRRMKTDASEMESISEMAAAVNFSVSKLNKVFKQHVGIGPGAYLRELKMQIALYKHTHQSLSWTAIAYELGYADIASFSKAYKRMFGASPTAKQL